jgi:hypothetical protein
VFSERCDINFSRVFSRVERLLKCLFRIDVKQTDSRQNDSTGM